MPGNAGFFGGITVKAGQREPLKYEQLTSLATAAGLTPPTDTPGASLAFIQAEDQDIRWRDDGIDPTTTAGMLLAAGDTYIYTGNMSAIKFIEVAASAKINVSYYS